MQTIIHSRASIIERLEPRIAPASASVSYIDFDNDIVKIIASKPGTAAPPLDLADLVFANGQLKTLTLTEDGFDGASIAFKVTRKTGGDGLANIGYINASSVDLDKVIVKGDLGRIRAGDGLSTNGPSLNLLQTRTMGTLGLSTQGFVGELVSEIDGDVGVLKVLGDFTDANFAADRIASVFIGGDLTGGTYSFSGEIFTSVEMGDVRIGGDVTGGAGGESGLIRSLGSIGDVRIGGNVTGGSGPKSGWIASVGPMGDVRIGGDVTGGAGELSGTITSGPLTGSTVPSGAEMGNVRIGGNLTGGAGIYSGQLGSTDAMGDVSIGGSVTGGSRPGSGQVASVGSMGHVRIGGNLIGGSIAGDVSLSDSGEVFSLGRIASVTIGGSLIAGSDASSVGSLLRCGAIVAGDDLGPVKIGGSILGNLANPALIIAKGQDVKPTTGSDIAIASLTVGGDVRFARILGGFTMDRVPTNADASIGKVTVGSDWVASSLLAGSEEITDGYKLQTVGNTPLLARIASIVIKGDVTGALSVDDSFGFVAQQIDKLKIGPRVFTLTAGPGNNQLLFSGDVHLFEVSEPG